jgi:uncharacterized protein involved in cysteine biosynthesis
MRDLWKGAMAPLYGLFFLLGDRALRGYIVVPGLIQLAAFVGLAVAAVFSFKPLLEWLVPKDWEDSMVALILGGIMLGLLMLAALVLLASLVANVAAAPVLDLMSEQLLKKKMGDRYTPKSAGVVKSLQNQIGHALVFLVAQALIAAAWLGGLLIPVAGTLLSTAFAMTVTGYLLCVSFIDYPMGVSARPWTGRYSYFLRRLALGIGFGAHVMLLQFIPFTLAASVAGACLLYAEDPE